MKSFKDLVLDGTKNVGKLNVPYMKPDQGLRYYQKQGVCILYMYDKFILYDQMGFGKTVQSFSAYAMRKAKNPDLKLIYCTIKSGILQAEGEMNYFFEGLKTVSLVTTSMSAASRKAVYEAADKDCYFLAHRTFVQDAPLIAKNLRPFVLILDEANYFKGLKSQAHSVSRVFSRIADAMWLLTADPIEKSLEDAYGLMDVVDSEVFGTYAEFMENYCHLREIAIAKRDSLGRQIKIKTISGFKNKKYFRSRFNTLAMGRTREDVINELPQLMVKDIVLELEAKDYKIYKSIEKGLLTGVNSFKQMKDVGDSDPSILEVLARCRLVLGAPRKVLDLLIDNRKTIEANSDKLNMERMRVAMNSSEEVEDDEFDFAGSWTEKLDDLIVTLRSYTLDTTVKSAEIKRLLSEDLSGEKVIVFSSFRTVIDFLEQELADFKPLRITGSENGKIREANRKLFSESKDRNVILITTAGIRALNLQAASTIICHDMPDTWGKLRQLIGRIIRIGSQHEFAKLICLMVAGTIDAAHYQRLYKTQKDVEVILGNLGQDKILSDSGLRKATLRSGNDS